KPKKDNPFLRNTSVIAADQVFTVEPGIYFIEMLLAPLRHGPHAARIDWKLTSALSALGGVRIEDDLRVTKDGSENLTRAVLPA
ncbi:MAG: M24 family metallopeptidase, partial [Polyangia bacterium]